MLIQKGLPHQHHSDPLMYQMAPKSEENNQIRLATERVTLQFDGFRVMRAEGGAVDVTSSCQLSQLKFKRNFKSLS